MWNCAERPAQSDAEVSVSVEPAADDPQCHVTVPCIYQVRVLDYSTEVTKTTVAHETTMYDWVESGECFNVTSLEFPRGDLGERIVLRREAARANRQLR